VTSRVRILVVGLGAAALVALAGVGVWRLALRDTSEPVSVGDALRRFRDEAAGAGGRIPPGVYVYATTGFESVSALGGSRHRYPARSTITARPDPCGVSLRWEALTTRSSTFTLCAGDGELRLAAWTEEHEFFGQPDRTEWQCSETVWLPEGRAPGARSSWRCRSDDTVQTGTLTVVGEATVLVEGEPVRAVRVRATVRETGAARGRLEEERWLEPETGLPLRIVYGVRTENPSPIGDVTFDERFGLRLLSLEPRT
jgi:hypothetical protein